MTALPALLVTVISYLHYIIWGGGGVMFLVAARRLNKARDEHFRARNDMWDRERQLIDMIIAHDDTISKALQKLQKK
jgi:hypothetical protein